MSISSLAELELAVGSRIGPTSWITVDQHRIDLFADATDDHQWIHVDPERAAAGPYGTTIAHGFLTLSFVPSMIWQVLQIKDEGMWINYGLDRVRFPAPLPVNSHNRSDVQVQAVQKLPNGFHIELEVSIERERGDKPVCIARSILRFYN